MSHAGAGQIRTSIVSLYWQVLPAVESNAVSDSEGQFRIGERDSSRLSARRRSQRGVRCKVIWVELFLKIGRFCSLRIRTACVLLNHGLHRGSISVCSVCR